MFTPPNVSRVTCHVSHVTCHMSHVTCHMSHVTCHMSHVTCHMSRVTFFFIIIFWQSGEAYRWRVCYQPGLPRLVFLWEWSFVADLAVGNKWFKKKLLKKNMRKKKKNYNLQVLFLFFVIKSHFAWLVTIVWLYLSLCSLFGQINTYYNMLTQRPNCNWIEYGLALVARWTKKFMMICFQ